MRTRHRPGRLGANDESHPAGSVSTQSNILFAGGRSVEHHCPWGAADYGSGHYAYSDLADGALVQAITTLRAVSLPLLLVMYRLSVWRLTLYVHHSASV